MLVLTDEDVHTLLSSLNRSQIVKFMDSLARALTDTSMVQPPRQLIPNPEPSSLSTFIMPAFLPSGSSIKICALDSSEGSTNTSPKGSLLLFKPDGSLDAVLNAAEVTGFRTALASMIPFVLRFLPELVSDKYNKAHPTSLPPPLVPSQVVVFGAGLQAEWAVKLLLALCSPSDTAGRLLDKITIVNRTLSRADSLISKVRSWYKRSSTNLPIRPALPTFECYELNELNAVELEHLVAAADAIFCCTPAQKPLFPAAYLLTDEAQKQTRYVSAIGSYTPEMREVDPQLLEPSPFHFGQEIIVDSKDSCLLEAGELIAAQHLERLRNRPALSMWEVGKVWEAAIRNKDDWRVRMMRNVLYKSVGTGAMDLAIGKCLIRLARELPFESKVGIEMKDF